ncbi:MAG TPA: TMEM14 family protein [Chthoniobacterales bacterium]|jgi:uncharacterized membrane protein (UPF0136 family)
MNYLSLVTAFYFIFGALTQIGGVIGFVKAKSRASLIAGLVAGGLLDLAGFLLMRLQDRPQIGLGLGTAITVLLLGRFAPAFFRTKKVMPAGMITLLGIVSLVLSIAAWTKL